MSPSSAASQTPDTAALGRRRDPVGTRRGELVRPIRPKEVDRDRSQLILETCPRRDAGDLASDAGRRPVGLCRTDRGLNLKRCTCNE